MILYVMMSGEAAIPSPGERVARRAGCGMRGITADTVQSKGL